MADSTKALSTKLATAGAPMVPAAFESNVKNWYKVNRRRILAMVGGQEDRVALYIASAFAQVNRIPKLLECSPESFFECLIYSMGTSLLPGPMQECVFVPFAGKATFVPMYQGLVKLAYNSGFVTRVAGHVVWEADKFEYDPAEEKIYHRIAECPEKDRGQRIAAYTTIKNRFGEILPMVKSAEFIQSIKNRSKAAKSSDSPWNSPHPSDVDAMWLKTCFKQAAKWVPKSSSPVGLQLGRALELDNLADTEEAITSPLLGDDIDRIKQDVIDVAPRMISEAEQADIELAKAREGK